MAFQQAVKTYPLLRWLLIASGALVVAGLFVSRIITDPNDAEPTTLLYFVGGAIVLPFLALVFPRREVVTFELPTDSLAQRTKQELEGILQQLDTAKGAGEMDEARYTKARQKILAALKGKK